MKKETIGEMKPRNFNVVVTLKGERVYPKVFALTVKKEGKFLVCKIQKADGDIKTSEYSIDIIESIDYLDPENDTDVVNQSE